MKTYYNTTNESEDYVKEQEVKNKTQEEKIYSLFQKYNKLTASEVFKLYKDNQTPITSIRRAVTNLYKANFIQKTTEKKNGLYGKPEYIYSLSQIEINEINKTIHEELKGRVDMDIQDANIDIK